MRRTKHKIERGDADLHIIENALRQNRNLKVVTGAFLMAIGITVILTILDNLQPKAALGVALVCMIIGFTGLYFLLNGVLRYDTQKNYLLKLITLQPEQVIWVYYLKVENMPFGIRLMQFTTLYIHLRNREKIAIQMPEHKIQLLMNLLRQRLHKASFGYSKMKEQMYGISPGLLEK